MQTQKTLMLILNWKMMYCIRSLIKSYVLDAGPVFNFAKMTLLN
mgnify:CR=1 FL=1